jgi:hypothetical protein
VKDRNKRDIAKEIKINTGDSFWLKAWAPALPRMAVG